MTKDSGKHDILPADGAIRHRALMPVTMPRQSDRQVRRLGPAAASTALQSAQDERGLMHGASRLPPSTAHSSDPRTLRNLWERRTCSRILRESFGKRRGLCLEPGRRNSAPQILRQDKRTGTFQGQVIGGAQLLPGPAVGTGPYASDIPIGFNGLAGTNRVGPFCRSRTSHCPCLESSEIRDLGPRRGPGNSSTPPATWA